METLILIVILGAGSILLEATAVKAFKPLGNFLKKYPILLGLPVSLGFSWLLGLPFGARGLIVLGAGILSTASMVIWYSVRSKVLVWLEGRKSRRSSTSTQPDWKAVTA